MFLSRFQPPVNMPKYSSEMNPSLWLQDHYHACRASGADNDIFIIHNLSLFLADSARAWLEHLSSNRIHSWLDLREISIGNFQAVSQQCIKSPANIIVAFFFETTCESLVHKLGCKHPRTTEELIDITMSHASGEEVVCVIFDPLRARGSGRRPPTEAPPTIPKRIRRTRNGHMPNFSPP